MTQPGVPVSIAGRRTGVSVGAVTRAGVAAGLIVWAWTSTAAAQLAPSAPDHVAVGEWDIAPVAEVRVRGEYDHGVDDQDWVFLSERVRMGLEAQRDAVAARVVLQDARVWDVGALADPFWSPGRMASTGAYEAWGEAHTAWARPLYVRIGRQPVTWGEGRLLGTSNWSPAGRTLDAVRAGAPIGEGDAELLAAVLSDPGAPLSAYGELFGARGRWAIHPLFSVEAYVLARLAQIAPASPIGNATRGQTYVGALRLYGEGYGWTWGAEGAYELGWVDTTAQNRAAWAAAGHVAHTFDRLMLLPSFRIGGSYASGDEGGSTYRGFDPLLPDVHVWQGAMDLFAWSNEEEVSARASIAPWTDAIAAVEYRYARLAQASGTWWTSYLVPIGQAPGNTNAELGHEIDASLKWSPWVSLELTAGYSVLVLGEGARAVLRAGEPSGVSLATLSHFAVGQATLHL